MLRTILSENQYDPKLVTTANMNPSRTPCAPPSAWPIPINSALTTPSSNAVLKTLDMVFSRFRLRDFDFRLSTFDFRLSAFDDFTFQTSDFITSHSSDFRNPFH